MAKYRQIYTEFWEDEKVVEEMTPEDKLFMVYLLTNPLTTQIGVYRITKKQIAFHLGYSMESVNSLMDRFINHHNLIKYNPSTREIAFKNWGKYNFFKGGKPVYDLIRKELKDIKDKKMLEWLFVSYLDSVDKPNEEISMIISSFLEGTSRTTSRGTNRITNGTTTGGQEEEKEEEREEERDIDIEHALPPKNNIDKEIKKNKYLDFVFMTQDEYEKLLEKLSNTQRDDYIERLNGYIGQHGKRYKSHYHTILNWYRNDKKQFLKGNNALDIPNDELKERLRQKMANKG